MEVKLHINNLFIMPVRRASQLILRMTENSALTAIENCPVFIIKCCLRNYISKWLDYQVFSDRDYKPEVPSRNP